MSDQSNFGSIPGYVRCGNYWHKAVDRVIEGAFPQCLTQCGITLDTIEVFPEPIDSTPTCPQCE